MDTKKRERYEAIVQQVIELAGGKKNILGIAHCATRLRLVLEDNDSADLKNMENVDLVKGVFVAGDQVQIIFGAGLVNDMSGIGRDTSYGYHESWRSKDKSRTKDEFSSESVEGII
ncbi:PTS transporter subunit EIIB [Dorea longicatena]|uniref:PTS transporter subunit EIIB n=1 Tax=Dorea longicatena TaxID=88431 RepID=UPI001FA85698|nr:PTS transporter subunit EIIB [Dorea longicatena]